MVEGVYGSGDNAMKRILPFLFYCFSLASALAWPVHGVGGGGGGGGGGPPAPIVNNGAT